MAKKFSIVTINKEHEIFLKGYSDIEGIFDSTVVIDALREYSAFTNIPVSIEHCLFLDFPNQPNEDIEREELEALVDVFDDLLEKNCIYSEERVDFDMPGLMEEDIVEEKF